jgi:hypothetical protein
MNGAVDVQELARVILLESSESADGADERGWWPVVAFTRDVRPVVLEINVN